MPIASSKPFRLNLPPPFLPPRLSHIRHEFLTLTKPLRMYSADGENKNIFDNGLGHFGMGRSSNIIIKGKMACWSAGWLGAVETGLYEAPTFSSYLSADSWWLGNAETIGGCHIFSFMFFPPLFLLRSQDQIILFFSFSIARIFFPFTIFFFFFCYLKPASQPASQPKPMI